VQVDGGLEGEGLNDSGGDIGHAQGRMLNQHMATASHAEPPVAHFGLPEAADQESVGRRIEVHGASRSGQGLNRP
jgi:hypothetical protein